MSYRVGNFVCIEPEPDAKCELCDTVAELRPYGPNGERICFDCGMKNPEATKQQLGRVLFGVEPDDDRPQS